MAAACRVCGNSKDNRILTAREMMFGTRETFDYLECSGCGTVQICSVPDLRQHYPDNYLSFDSEVPIGKTVLRRFAARFAGKYLLTGKGGIGKWIVQVVPGVARQFPPSLREFPLGLDVNTKILDFGCGTGRLLRSLHHFGFKDLTGADAFIEKDIIYPTGIRIFKRGLEDLEPTFDLIMLHHSFEHLPDPAGALNQIGRLMNDDSYCLIRIPVINFAWETYGTDWVQMDPPRHLFLYTERAFRDLAERARLSVEHVQYDSGAFQFWGSEQYRLDIPLTDPRSPWTDPSSTLFPSQQIDDWDREAKKLNAEGRGDMACFYLRRQ